MKIEPDWTGLWIALFVIGALLIIASQIASVRAWAGRVFGRVRPGLPSLGGIGGAVAAIGGKGWVRLLAIPLVVAGVFGVISYIEGRGADRERLKEAARTEAVLNHERDLADKAIGLAETTHRDRDRVRVVIAQAEEEIEDAVEAADFDRLYDAYVLGTHGVWFDLERSDSSDPAPPRIAPVRRSRSDAA